jgi:hypothetical protein
MEEVKEYPLSDSDIRKMLGDVKIWNYPQLKTIKDPNHLFDRKGRCILLCPNAGPTTGHWVCMMNYKDKVEYFDSYGEAPEQPKKGLGKQRLEALDIEHPDLTKLLRAIKKPVYYNTHKFQSESPSVASCGRWCCVRLLYYPKSLNYFKKVIDKSGLNGDDFVSGVTYDKLKK